MKSLVTFLFFLVATALVPAQESVIVGTVTSAKDNTPLTGVNITIKGTSRGTQTDFDGKYSIEANTGDILVFSYLGFKTKEVRIKNSSVINVVLKEDSASLEEVVIISEEADEYEEAIPPAPPRMKMVRAAAMHIVPRPRYPQNTESYAEIDESGFLQTGYKPLSTFSIDVDKASYSNMRRMINNGQKIPKDAIKVEELINYFSYNYKQPEDNSPFAIETELSSSPWNRQHQLVKIGLQGKKVPLDDVPPSNLVFLIDVSGSMHSPNKLPLLKSAFKLLVNQLRSGDKVSIVTYASGTHLVLKPTSGKDKNRILEAIDQLEAGGSTAGRDGLQLAYDTAEEYFMKKGNNRVILATDGDFNVGPSSDKEMEELITEKRKSGVFLTCLGFGMGNYKDSKLETLADKGNGNHAYIDNMQEAQRVLGTEFGGTLYTIAKDVKIQVEFNPAKVQAYRLIGYENRMLDDEDFKDDTKDAGELGSGHTVTALYEIIPTGVKSKFLKEIDSLKYSKVKPSGNFKDELFTVRFRYKKPDSDTSKEIVHVVKDRSVSGSPDFNFAASVAMWGMYLRDSEYLNGTKKEDIIALAEKNRGKDPDGSRAEFIRLMKSYTR
ncbi:vWA domain-containing protein [Sinomicrobium weinanense]|uniref:von Willebrand factor type A domain-containing protein n=1 Tax=Sinomicrobium weinanense TaxID=2842200 RepID=A0A926JUN7_9FLAO|nr:VWA domain-containing protein [Sinomicrobium weinanense]MBC9797795.1 von Willebrand factor type A domain-containing protein [Sinomicrobium weinanense]MBU3124879.1 von Willebrand factor type A domain-containing protein [Sinomicrobium weinanense]